MQEVIIGSRLVGPRHPPFIVAEMSGNHNGSLTEALALVDAAKKAGVDAIKLQTYTPDTITLNVDREEFFIRNKESPWKDEHLYGLYQRAYTPWEWHRPIFEYCQQQQILAFSTPFDETAVDFLENLNVPCYKIASLEIVDHPLIRKIAATKKPMIMSTGGASLQEISEAVEVAQNEGNRDIILLKCTTSYPASPADAHLCTIPHMASTFQVCVGLSDHTLSLGVPIASIALGSCLIEKHLTLSRANGGVDDVFSLEPSEFQMLVKESKLAWQALGQVLYHPLNSEKTSLSLRPSLYFVEDLPENSLVEPHHVRSVRPAKGLPPKEFDKIIGLQLKQNVIAGTPVSWEVFKPVIVRKSRFLADSN